MTKEQMLGIIRLLSAMESWSFSVVGARLPDYLIEDLNFAIGNLTKELLK